MLARFSVKKPFYVLVAVIIVLILGAVSVTYMKTNLLPSFQMPYLAVITTDPGAAPEQVQEEVTDVLEGPLGSLSGVTTVQSQSAENYSMVFLEFADGTDMDSALVKTSAAVNSVASQLPDTAGTPTYMEISMNMMATMYLGITDTDKSMGELTQYVEDTVIPALERQDGVANVSAAGGITDTLEVRLSQDKIDNVNDGILGEANDKLSEASSALDAAERRLDAAAVQLEEQQAALDEAKSQASQGFSQTVGADGAISAELKSAAAQMQVLQIALSQAPDEATRAQVQGQIDALSAQMAAANEQLSALKSADAQKTETILSLADAQAKLDQGKAQVEQGRSELAQQRSSYEEQRDSAKSNANIDKLVTKDTIAGLIQAQNFEMPAGYAGASDSDEQWMVKVGEKYTSAEQIRDMVLTKIDGVGDVRLGDVADVVETSSEGNAYAKLDGQPGIVLSLTKTSTANTGEVSKAAHTAIGELQDQSPSTKIATIMDQATYIDLYISTILKSLLLGALLAVVVLAVFLRNIKPTLVVAFSIPFSVLFALVIMYFWGLDINIMTLGALSLAIGMLVDNSIVVMENIYRMRARGLSATRAAAQGAVQVTGAIVASTITSVCVFFPFVFTTGTVRQLMAPFALTISFALLASLIVALTVVPALGSKMFSAEPPKEYKWFAKMKDAYERALGFCLRHRALTLAVPALLFVASLALVVQMGVVMMPNMTQSQIEVVMEVNDEETPQTDGYKLADEVGQRVAALDGIAQVGMIDSNTGVSTMMSGMDTGGSLYTGRFMLYATVDAAKITTEAQVEDLQGKIVSIAPDLGVTLTQSQSMDMSDMMGGDATVTVSGLDNETVLELSRKVMDAMKGIDGYTEVENGQEEADPTLHLVFDKDELARLGTTSAQVYQQVSALLSDQKKATTIREDGRDVEVRVDDANVKDTTRQDLLDQEFTDGSGASHKLSEVASVSESAGVATITRENMSYVATVTAKVEDGYNVTLLARQLQPALDEIEVPQGYEVKIAGVNESITDMLQQMLMLAVLGFVLIYLVMVAQFQSLKGPFIILFTVPLAFTGGLFALVIAHEQLSMMALLGFVILMGTVVNNGIVFVDYANQLRLGGMAKRAALIACGRTRMRPILATALTTIISMCALIFSTEIGASMERGMALVVAGGLLYATFMTLFVVPVIYDIANRKPMVPIDVGGDADEDADDAAAYIAVMGEDARETYEYVSRRERRRQRRAEKRGARGADEKPAKAGEDEKPGKTVAVEKAEKAETPETADTPEKTEAAEKVGVDEKAEGGE